HTPRASLEPWKDGRNNEAYRSRGAPQQRSALGRSHRVGGKSNKVVLSETIRDVHTPIVSSEDERAFKTLRYQTVHRTAPKDTEDEIAIALLIEMCEAYLDEAPSETMMLVCRMRHAPACFIQMIPAMPYTGDTRDHCLTRESDKPNVFLAGD